MLALSRAVRVVARISGASGDVSHVLYCFDLALAFLCSWTTTSARFLHRTLPRNRGMAFFVVLSLLRPKWRPCHGNKPRSAILLKGPNSKFESVCKTREGRSIRRPTTRCQLVCTKSDRLAAKVVVPKRGDQGLQGGAYIGRQATARRCRQGTKKVHPSIPNSRFVDSVFSWWRPPSVLN